MGFMDELKRITRPYAEDDNDFEDDFDLEDDRPARAPRAAASRPAARPAARPSAFDDVLDDLDSPRPTSSSRRGENKVVSLPGSNSGMQVVLVKPDRFDNVSEIAEHLRNKHAVVLNLETASKDVSRRLVDFLSGCAYALDGKIKKVAVSTYIITPCNVALIGDLLDELENNSVYL